MSQVPYLKSGDRMAPGPLPMVVLRNQLGDVRRPWQGLTYLRSPRVTQLQVQLDQGLEPQQRQPVSLIGVPVSLIGVLSERRPVALDSPSLTSPQVTALHFPVFPAGVPWAGSPGRAGAESPSQRGCFQTWVISDFQDWTWKGSHTLPPPPQHNESCSLGRACLTQPTC